MSVIALQDWRRPGCGPDCWPRRHDPESHEAYGYRQALEYPPIRLVRTGPLTIDLRSQQVWVSGVPLSFVWGSGEGAPSLWRLLEIVALHVGCVVTQDMLTQHVMGVARDGASDHAIRVYTSRLRKQLGTAGALITTIYGRGLRLEQREPI